MKPPTLPTRISSVFAFLWMLFLAAIAILTLYTLLFTARSHAAFIDVGGITTKDRFPFGINAAGTAAYVGEYQQIFDHSVFPTANVISQIAFREASGGLTGDVTYRLSIGLLDTARTPAAPGLGFASGAVPVFSGSVVAHITALTSDFDFKIDLTTPFLYDPALGNLLLNVTIFSATGRPGELVGGEYRVDETANQMARIYKNGGEVVAIPNADLSTRFTTAPVPEAGGGRAGAGGGGADAAAASARALSSLRRSTFDVRCSMFSPAQRPRICGHARERPAPAAGRTSNVEHRSPDFAAPLSPRA